MPALQKQKQLQRIRRTSAWAGAVAIDAVIVIFGVLCFRLAPTPDDAALNLAILGASCVVGWLVGTLLSPGNLREQGQFGTTAKAISTFISGYALAKIDDVLNAIFAPKMLLESGNVLPAFRVTMVIAGVVGMALVLYMFRVYILEWVPESKEPSGEEGIK